VPQPQDRTSLQTAVERALADFLGGQRHGLWAIDTVLAEFVDHLVDLTSGGKRIRPAFCYAGWLGAGGDPALLIGDGEATAEPTPIARAAAALELLQTSALIHDDLIDASDTRRGRPAAHVRLADEHRRAGYPGDADRFGANAAILLGDLAQAWADEALRCCGLPTPQVLAGLRCFDTMRTEVITGQYADVVAEADPGTTPDRAMLVLRFKSGRYSVLRPLELGGLLADASEAVLLAYRAVGDPVGEAFQLRDDLLGVFGDPQVTGKPAGDDLRQGKRTVLVTLAQRAADTGQRERLDAFLGDRELTAAQTDEARQILTDSGAVAEVERLIATRVAEAEAALADAPLEPAGKDFLAGLIVASAHRSL
jgi:geranylgeranyl diphosphate synthase, type I